jgi:iron-sulfur cluster assembly accessory protein
MSECPPNYDLEKPLENAKPVHDELPFTVTDAAIAKILEFAEKKNSQGKAFRITVKGGGCSGLQYIFDFDDKKDGDFAISAGSTEVITDVVSLSYFKGSTMDYIDSFTNAGFSLQNPNAKASCSCGLSFKA